MPRCGIIHGGHDRPAKYSVSPSLIQCTEVAHLPSKESDVKSYCCNKKVTERREFSITRRMLVAISY